jgi:hypothetical protein
MVPCMTKITFAARLSKFFRTAASEVVVVQRMPSGPQLRQNGDIT